MTDQPQPQTQSTQKEWENRFLEFVAKEAASENEDYRFAYELARQRVSLMGLAVGEAYIPELEEAGWSRAGLDGKPSVAGFSRIQMNAQARYFYHNDPQLNNIVSIHNNYTFGRGVKVQAKDDAVQAIIDDFWNDKTNAAVVSRATAQHKLNREKLLTGEVAFLFFRNTINGKVQIRHLDPNEIKVIIYENNDPTRPMWYKRVFRKCEYDFSTGKETLATEETTVHIPDFRNASVKPAEHERYRKGMGLENSKDTECYIFHTITNDLDGRGVAEVATSIPWIRAFKGFMEDRVTLNMALAIFAFKTKIKGNKPAVDRMMEQWGDYETASKRYGSGDFRERRIGGNNLFENDAINTEQFKTDSGAGNAYMDGRMIRQMIAVGSKLMEHYAIGDASTGNLATTTAMELPMLKVFQFAQETFKEIFQDILWFVKLSYFQSNPNPLATVKPDTAFKVWVIEPKGETNLSVLVRFPQIIQKDIPMLIGAIAAMKSTESTTMERQLPYEETVKLLIELLELSDDAQATFESMVETGIAMDIPQVAAFGEVIKREVKGNPLPPDEGEEADDVTEDEIEKALDDWENLPSLNDLIDQLDIPDEVIEESKAIAHA